MGCCCKKKGERLLEEQKKEFDYIKAKKLIVLCISEDYCFKILEETNKGEDCVDPLKDILTKLKEYIKPLIKKNFGEKLGNKLKNIRLWNRITNLVTEEIKVEYNNSIVIDFMTVSGLINKFKNKEGIIKILKDIGDHYKSPFLAVTNLAMSFLNLCTSVKSFYNTLIDFRQKKTKYTDILKQIHQNFESHKKKIRNLEINKLNEVEDIKGTIESIIDIGKDINKEKYDLYLLIFEIQEEIERKVSEKSKSGVKLLREY